MILYFANMFGVKGLEEYLDFKVDVLAAYPSFSKDKPIEKPEFCGRLFLDPGACVIPRTDKNTECIVYYPDSGYVICRGSSNGDVLEQMTEPGFTPENKRRPGAIIDIKSTVNLKNRKEKLVNYMISAAQELKAVTKKDPRFVHHKDGQISIKTGNQIHKRK